MKNKWYCETLNKMVDDLECIATKMQHNCKCEGSDFVE